MPTFGIGDEIKAKLSYTSEVKCQQLDHSKCNKICDIDTTSRRMKLLIFKPKTLGFKLQAFLISKFPHRK